MIDFALGKLRLWRAAAACAGLFMTQAAGAHPAAFTLNDVMQAPFASDMLAAPTGTAVAWVFNAKGCSNIWVADPTHGAKARQITPYTEDAGFDIGELSARLNRAVSACAREIHKSVRQQEENGKPDYFFAFTR
jgi:hypothetical protein